MFGRGPTPATAIVLSLDAGLAAHMGNPRSEDGDQAGDDRAQKGKENDRVIHLAGQPFITLTSSTAMDPRLR